MKKIIAILLASLISGLFPLLAYATPDAPILDETETTIEELTDVITGSGDPGSHIWIDGEDTLLDVDEDGYLALQVDLTGEGETDTFTITLQDDEGNESEGTDISITCWREGNTIIGSSTVTLNTESGATDEDEEASDDAESSTHPFTDIDGHWAEDYIVQLYTEGIVSGYPDNTFRPDQEITRAETLKIALERFGLAEEEGETPSFTDLDAGLWHYEYIKTGWTLEVIEGYSEDNTFRPQNNINRAEALRILIEAGFLSEDLTVPSSTEGNLDDVTSSHWFAHYSGFATTQGIIQGYSDALFHGERKITRAQVCKIVVLLAEYLAQQPE